jgi:hypothetical protein
MALPEHKLNKLDHTKVGVFVDNKKSAALSVIE